MMSKLDTYLNSLWKQSVEVHKLTDNEVIDNFVRDERIQMKRYIHDLIQFDFLFMSISEYIWNDDITSVNMPSFITNIKLPLEKVYQFLKQIPHNRLLFYSVCEMVSKVQNDNEDEGLHKEQDI